MSIWAVPEPRLGGRLRLNAFCGLNLASHALGLNARPFAWAYGDDVDLDALLTASPQTQLVAAETPEATETGKAVAAKTRGKRIGRIGDHPTGFDTCAYDRAALSDLAGVTVEEMALEPLFDRARAVPQFEANALRGEADTLATGLDDVDQAELDRSLRLKLALDGVRADGSFDAFAIRCWPETFTEYGGAICGPAAMLGEARVPCACEADVYGALTQLILAQAADAPVFLTDLVDMDVADNTGVVWHCGQAPISMRDPDAGAMATLHTNRKMPLLFEFPLKPGRVTLMRISQSFGETSMIISAGDMLKRDMAFTGTSGVIRFEREVAQVLPDMIACGLEHHMALAYGDHREALRGTAGALGLKVLEI